MRVKVWFKHFIKGKLYTAAGEEFTRHARLWSLLPPQNFSLPNVSEEGETSLVPFAALIPIVAQLPALYSLFASYASDNREFSDKEDASARLTTRIELDYGCIYKIERLVVPTLQVRGILMDLIGKESDHIQLKEAKPTGTHCVDMTEESFHIAFVSRLANPFFEICGSSLAPPAIQDFDLILNFKDPEKIAVSLKGRVTHFPAFGAYLKIDDNDPVCLYQYDPPPGVTPLDMFYGWHKVAVDKTISIHPQAAAEIKAGPIAPPTPTQRLKVG